MSRPAAAVALMAVLTGCAGGAKDGSATDGPAMDGGGTDGGTTDSGPTDGGTTVTLSPGDPWARQEVAAPGSITFSELLYHPASDGDLEWLELFNPMVLDMDLSGWSLDGGVTYDFAEGTVLPAGGYLVVAASPTLLQDQTGFADALGPYVGKLSNGGERIDLRNNSDRLIDTVEYGDDQPWPVQADGSGLSLAKLAPAAASDHAENWTVSAQLGGTPGASNLLDPLEPPTTLELVAQDATWRFDTSGAYPASDWADPGHDDSAWDSGQATFFAGVGESDVAATAWVTADNYFALYLGQADGSDLRLVGEDSDGSWTTVEEIDLDVTALDHLYLAAWELTGDSTSPQMIIGEVELSGDSVGTNASDFEWVLGPTDGNPGALPTAAPPTEEDLALLVEDADLDALWAVPAVDAGRSSSPWGSSVGGSFTDVASFVWADTFDNDSVTNSEDTFALFRSLDPLVAPRGLTELSELAITTTFRTSFSFDGDPAWTQLHLECVLDDGAVFYLNGVEVLRDNLPDGPVDASTLATSAVDPASDLRADISAASLVNGSNLLAVELHQAQVDDTDLTFGCALTAEIWPESAEPTVVLNEVAAGSGGSSDGSSDGAFWVELLNVRSTAVDISGLILASAADSRLVLPAGELDPGELLVVDDDVGMDPQAGDLLFLYSADGSALLDAVRVAEGPRARSDEGGPWRTPSEATPAEDNLIDVATDVVINEIQYHRAPLMAEGEPVTARSEEWVELFNRGDTAVDLSGWQLVDAVAYQLPEGTVLASGAYLVVAGDAESLRADHPDIAVVGDFSGRLSNDGERILLLDAAGNPADELRYFDGGRWPAAADGGGSSLELQDPWADNAAGEAWAASDEGPRSAWVSTTIRGVAEPSAVGPDGTWDELVLGLLDAGEVLIDDLSVVVDPDTDPVELVPNGGFDDGDDGWRLLGNHRHSQVVPDPDDAADPVLQLVATGPTGHMHNHAETTLLQPIEATEYVISFRARWISGGNQVHSRLYFNRLPHTTLVERPDLSGTPGQPNSRLLDNLGPTFSELGQDVALPAPAEPVLVSISAEDPDGVAALTLWSSVDGGAWQGLTMTQGEAGQWSAELPGEAAGSIVQIYVQAEDGLGATSTYPADGADSRALYTVDDGLAATNGLHNLRILMTPADSDWLHDDVNLMSNDLVGATVVYDEAEVFYDVGVRLKGSERGRPAELRLGYGIGFRADQPFRGSHTTVLIDRSEGVDFGQREVLLNLVMTHAGSVSGEYNDLIQLVAPQSAYTGSAELQLDRFSNLVLASQFADGDSGTRFEYELIYYPLTTDDGTAEGNKLPQPDSVVGTSLTDLGTGLDDPKEAYRWNFLIKNNTREDDYDGLIELCQTLGLGDAELLERADSVIDVDQWLRSFAFATLSGATDQYGGAGSQHNADFYVRPSDQRMLYFPHDLDYFGSSTMAVVGNSDLAQLIDDPANHRAYYGHLYDIMQRAYGTDYLAPWCDQLATLLPAQDFDAYCEFIDDRASWVRDDSSDALTALYPSVDFQITTSGGGDFSVAATEVVLEGQAWVDVRQIQLDGTAEPLALTWIDTSTWQLVVPLEDGDNDLSLVASDLHGQVVGTDDIVVTSTSGR